MGTVVKTDKERLRTSSKQVMVDTRPATGTHTHAHKKQGAEQTQS